MTEQYEEPEGNICEKLKINFAGDPFGVNGLYYIDYRSNQEGWVRPGFRIYPGNHSGQTYWFLVPGGQTKKFIYAPRKSDCPSGY